MPEVTGVDAGEDEIANLVAEVKAQEEPEPEEELEMAPEIEEEQAPPPKRRRVRKTAAKAEPSKTIDELDVDELLPEGLPKPEGNIRGLGDLYAKFGVGERPEMKVHLYRSYPKIAPGGSKFDGFYDEYDIPITEQQIQADYGGGQYRIVVVGPHPTNPRLPKHYGSHSIGLAGDPVWDRVPRALQGHVKPDTSGNPPPLPAAMMMSHESPKLAEAALKMFEGSARAEREERRRVEEKYEQRQAAGFGQSDAVAAAERRRADDLIHSERERASSERRYLEQRMEELRQESDTTRRQFESDQRGRPSVGQEIAALAQAGLFGGRGDDGMAKDMLTQILQKQRDEVAAIHQQHGEFVRSIREGHQSEVAAVRMAHEREMVAEREASRSREERIEERLKSEREERDRDRLRSREMMEERDRNWKDRMDSSLQVQQSSWESRHQSLTSTYENRIQWHQQEIDKLRGELIEAKSKQEEKGDVFSQLAKHRELQSLMKEFSGVDAAAAAGVGGIGISGGGDDWKQAAAEGLVERAPAIFEKIFGGGGGTPAQQPVQPTPQQMQQFHEGQVVDTAQGKMEVVRNPADGQLALAPKEALDRHRAQIAAVKAQGGGLLPSEGTPRRRSRANGKRPRSRSAGVVAVPNLAEGLPRRRPPWEGGGDDDEQDALIPPPPPVPPPVPRMSTRKPDSGEGPREPIEMSAIERQGLRLIAKEVHESVQRADDPDEFVQSILQKYPPAALQQIVGAYSDRQIVQGIEQLEPNSAGATPAGKQFVMAAFRMLRGTLQS
jgi:hypothetical protein